MPKRSAQIGGFGCIDDSVSEARGGRENPNKLPRDAGQIGIGHDPIMFWRLAV